MEVFEGETPLRGHSFETGFTDFVQYQEDGPEESEQTPPSTLRAGARSSGLCQPLDKPVMQCCLEHFQQFLSRLIILYIIPGQVDQSEGQGGELMDPFPLEGSPYCESHAALETIPRDFVAAFTAACQLFLECSSFPVYIAEGNLKSSPTLEEPFG